MDGRFILQMNVQKLKQQPGFFYLYVDDNNNSVLPISYLNSKWQHSRVPVAAAVQFCDPSELLLPNYCSTLNW